MAPARALKEMGFELLATRGTAKFLQSEGLEVASSTKCSKAARTSSTRIKNGEVQLVFNTTEGSQALSDSLSIRRTALQMKVPYYTTVAGAAAATEAIAALREGALEVAPLQSYL